MVEPLRTTSCMASSSPRAIRPQRRPVVLRDLGVGGQLHVDRRANTNGAITDPREASLRGRRVLVERAEQLALAQVERQLLELARASVAAMSGSLVVLVPPRKSHVAGPGVASRSARRMISSSVPERPGPQHRGDTAARRSAAP